MKRRDFLKGTAQLGLFAALPASAVRALAGRGTAVGTGADAKENRTASAVASPLKPPAQGSVPVAFLVSDGAVVIDF